MPTLDIRNVSGEVVGKIELSEDVFGTEVNEHLLWEAVKWQRAKRRAGTHSTRTVAEVVGTRKKPYRQKGTGNARQGSMKAHHHVGGGRAFGPKPRDYEYNFNRKAKKGALRSALSLRVKEQKLIVLDAFTPDKAKTKLIAQTLEKLVAKDASGALIIDAKDNQALARGTKNLKAAKWLAPEGLNVEDVLRYDTLIMTAPSVKAVEKALTP